MSRSVTASCGRSSALPLRGVLGRSVACLFIACLAAFSPARALTAADSGWRPIFNGKTFPADSFYVYQDGYFEIPQQTKFKVDSGMIHAGGSYALLVTKKEYAYYKVRVDYRFGPAVGPNGNAGLMVLMDNVAAKTVKSGTRPRSIEVNCRRDNNYPWSLWGGRGFGPYMTSYRKPGTPDQYESKADGGVLFTDDITADNNRVWRSSYPMVENPPGQWNHGEAWVYGDSGAFYLNYKLREITWGWTTKLGDPTAEIKSGGIGVQTEGFDIWYRNWEIMELNPDGSPVNIAKEKFTLRKLAPATRSVLSLDRGSLEAVLQDTPTGQGFQWLDVYTSQGRQVMSLHRSDSDPSRFQWNQAGAGSGFASGPYLLKWSAK